MTIILKPIISVNCSKEIFLFCIFLQIEKGVFSRPVIVALIPLLFKCSINSIDIDLKFIYDDQFVDIEYDTKFYKFFEYWSHAEKTAFSDNTERLSKLLKT